MTAREIIRSMFSFLFKVVLVLLLIVVMFVIGTMVGYGVIGGGDPMAVFEPDIWDHLLGYFVRP